MKRIVFLLGLSVAGAAVVCLVFWGFQAMAESLTPPVPSSTPPVRLEKLLPLPDVDALAQRLPYGQDVYAKLRDEALADFAQSHPGAHPYDAEASATIKLLAYLCVWDDFYGENLWPTVGGHLDRLQHEVPDQLWLSGTDIWLYANSYSDNDDGVNELNNCTDRLCRGKYPAAFRLRACQTALVNMISVKTQPNTKDRVTSSVQALPAMADQASACFRELVAQHPPHDYLYRVGYALIVAVKADEPTLKQISTGIDAAFSAADRNNPEADILDAEFYTEDAWCARGDGWANTVTTAGFQLMGERLGRAESILNDVYARAPQEPGISQSMMTVVLGLQAPADQMDLWFQRGQEVPGNLFKLYMAKRWYLLPRWYGSDEIVWNFGLECAKSTNWASKIPIMLAECVSDRADRDPTVYAQPEIWTPLEKVYRDYLAHYPNSTHYRSMFALSAAQGGHWDVAREQFKLLGDNWDRDVFSDDLYPATMQAVNAH